MSFFPLTENKKKISKNGIRLKDAEVDILFIVHNNNVMYINNEAKSLFAKEKHEKLDERVVNFTFSGLSDNSTIEFFIAFDGYDAYSMFTLQKEMTERLDYVMYAILRYFSENNIKGVFSPVEQYSTTYIYTFKAYYKNNKYFMINNNNDQAYLIDESGIKRDNVNEIKKIFWGE